MKDDEMKAVARFAKENNIEMNFGNDGTVNLYAEAAGLHVCIEAIKPKYVRGAVDTLQAFRDAGWKVN